MARFLVWRSGEHGVDPSLPLHPGPLLLYTHLLIHAEIHIYILDTYRRNDNRLRKEDARRLLYKYIYLSIYCKGSKGLFNGLHERGCWEPNINFIFWPHCYDRHVVSFLFSCCSTRGLGLTLSGVSESPLGRVWPSLPHLVSSCLEFYWQLLWHPELNWVK